MKLILGWIILLFPLAVVSDVQSSLWMGGAGGYSLISTDIATEADKNGYHLELEFLGSLRAEQLVFDLGLGWLYNKSSGSRGVIREDSVTSYGPFVSLASRYAFESGWQIGLMGRSLFGTDFNFGSSVKKSNLSLFIGPQVAYEWNLDALNLRLFASPQMDLNIDSRVVVLALAGIQLGLPIISSSREYSAKAKVTEKISDFYVDNVKIGMLLFALAEAHLAPEDLDLVAKLSHILKSENGWSGLRIEGHTDSRGSDAFNRVLSKARAQSVRDAFVKHGITKVEVVGFGSDKPHVLGEGESVWKQNRRVEIILDKCTDQKLLRKIQKLFADQSNP